MVGQKQGQDIVVLWVSSTVPWIGHCVDANRRIPMTADGFQGDGCPECITDATQSEEKQKMDVSMYYYSGHR
jgi:hypothetical protein